MANDTVTIYQVHERIRGDYSFILRDRDGNAVPGSILTSATMSLYLNFDPLIASIFLNGRNQQSILNMNNVTIDANGKVLWDIQSDDMVIVDDKLNFEQRVAAFEFIFPTGLILHEVAFNVRSVRNI